MSISTEKCDRAYPDVALACSRFNRPINCSVSANLLISYSLWVAIKEIRNLLVSGGTVGGRIAGIWIP